MDYKSAQPGADSEGAEERDAPASTVSASASTARPLPAALAPLADRGLWVIWRLEARANGKPTKRPYQPTQTGRLARVNDRRTWGGLRDAQQAVALGEADGIGLVLLQAEGYAALDLDKCRHPETGELDAWAGELIARCPGAYVEVTPSGAGLRIIGRADLDTGFQMVLQMDGTVAGAQVEIYHLTPRYITVTGQQIAGPASANELGDISDVVLDLAVRAAQQKPLTGDAPIASNPEAAGEIEDIAAALAAVPNEDLSWDEWSRIGMAAWRASGGSPDGFDAWAAWSERSSKHDPAACEERWDHWGSSSPPDRIGMGTLVHEARLHKPDWTHPSRRVDPRQAFDDAGDAAGVAAMEAAGKAQAGERDVLREVLGKVAWMPAREQFLRLDNGLMLTKEGFNTSSDLGLALLEVIPTNKSGRPVQKPADFAIEAGVRQVVGTLHLPGRERLARFKWGEGKGGALWFNTWTPPERLIGMAPSRDDDPRIAWFIRFAQRLIPDENELGMLFDYFADRIQRPEVKCLWAPVLFGEQGNGKDTLLDCWIRYGIGRHNVAWVAGMKLRAEQTETPWVEKHIVSVAELPSFHKADMYDFLKEKITGDSSGAQIARRLYRDTYVAPDHACWILTTNNADALALPSADERRFFIVLCAGPTLTAPEIEELRGHMTEENLMAVAAWLRQRRVGVTQWGDLGTYSAHRCPAPTAAKRMMAEAGRHPVQRWVEEWLAQPAQTGRTVISANEVEEAFENAQRSGFGSMKAAWSTQKAGFGMKAAGWSNEGDTQIWLVPRSMGVVVRRRVWWRKDAWVGDALAGTALRERLFAEAPEIREQAEEIEREIRRAKMAIADGAGGGA
jgi:hypothetical protein